MQPDITAALAGQVACLATAAFWAVSVALFQQPIRDFGARTVNMTKCTLAAVLQGLTVLVLGHATTLRDAPVPALGWLVLSGVVGLVLGDTALFGAVARLGGHRTLLLQTLAPLFTALIAAAWQGERPTGIQVGGSVAILAGVALVVAPRRTVEAGAGAWPAAGLAFGVLAAFGQGSGVVLAKVGMAAVPAVPASFVRLGAAAVGLVVLGLWSRRRGSIPDMLRTPRAMARVVPATLLGTYLALFLMMTGIALSPASVAAVLLATSPVFSLVVEAAIERRPITRRNLLGTLLAVAGVALLTAG